jgi:hypothetical protein
MITSWADQEDKANAKYNSIRGKSKHNTGGAAAAAAATTTTRRTTTTTTTTIGIRGSQ